MPFSSQKVLHSVIFQILMAMLLIAGMALASMALSVYVTVDTQDDAEAINLAGSLRMQSYRIGNMLSLARDSEVADPAQKLAQEMTEFSHKLYRSSIAELIQGSSNTPLEKSYKQVITNWEENMAPLLTSAQAHPEATSWKELQLQYNRHLDDYVADIDFMVTHLQRNTEGKIELLGMAEGISIFLIIFTMLFFIMKADSNFIIPLRGLVEAAKKVESGDLAHRTSYTGENELGLLSKTFNSMTASLEAQYRTLEQQVAERTEELRKSNEALYFLYKTSREIASSPHDQNLLNVFLDDLKKVVEVDLISLCINAEPNYAAYDVIATQRNVDGLCYGDCEDCDMRPQQAGVKSNRDISMPLKNRDDDYGFLFVRKSDDAELDAWKGQLLGTVAETLSTAFAFHHTLGQEHRVILHEERSAIARELHDSLAQSLSYMKLEVARLSKMIERGFDQDKILSGISDLQEGLNAAYKNLRELLVTFRVKLDAPNLRAALEHAVREFSDQTSAVISLDYDLEGYSLSPNEDIHILHIMREALNNAVKHARADHILIRCSRGMDGEAVFSVEDDGVGMSENPEKQHHYGIDTMRERAQQLSGALAYNSGPEAGTQVELRLRTSTTGLSA